MNPPVLAPRRTAAQILFSLVCEPVTRQLPFVLEPAAGFEPATSGLQVRCSTAELHRLGAGGRNRTPIPGLEGRCSTIELHPHRAPDSGRSLHLHRFSGIARRLATGSITADFATARPTSKRAGLEPALSSLRRAALRYPFARVLSVHPAASMLAPVFPGCHVICRPATYHGIEPPPFLPSLDKRSGIEPALSLLVAGGDPGLMAIGVCRRLVLPFWLIYGLDFQPDRIHWHRG